MARDLKLEVLLSMVEKVTGPLKKITGGSSAMARNMKAARDEIKELERTQSKITAFRKLSSDMQGTAGKLNAAQQRVRALKEEMRASGTVTDKFKNDFRKAHESVRDLTNKLQDQRRILGPHAQSLKELGVSTTKLGEHETALKGKIDAANAALTVQKNKLSAVAAQQKQLGQAHSTYGKHKQLAGSAAAGGATSLAAAYGIGRGIYAPIQEGKHFALEEARVNALGLGKETSEDAIKFAKAMKTYGTSATENLTLVRDAMTVFADAHHAELVAPTLAKMKFANESMYGEEQGADNERKFMDMLKVIELRGGLASEKAFKDQANIVQKVMTATGGRVGPEEWLNVIKTGGLAAKGLKDDAFYYQLEPLVQEMGGNRVGTSMMSAYQNLYQGRTTKRAANNLAELGLLDSSKVKHDKAGQVSFLDVGALKGSELFRTNQFEWMEKVLLPQMAAKGITDQRHVLDAIGSIFSNRTASNLFSQMYLQREQIHKNAKLNAGADGIDQLYDKGLNSAQGKELELLAKKHDAYKQMSDTLLPSYVEVLGNVTRGIQSINVWMKENPRTAAAMLKGLMIVGALAATFGTLAIVIYGILAPFAALRYGMALLNIKGGGVLSMLFNLGKTVLPLVGQGLMFIGRALLMNPIGLTITAIAAAGYLIWKNWSTLGPMFANIWDSIKVGFDNVKVWFASLPERFSEFGRMMMQGLANGISNAIDTVKNAVGDAGQATIDWFKEKLGIHSPSRVFAELGGYTMEGLQQGIVANQRGPLSAVAGIGKQLAAAGVLSLGVSGAALAVDNRAPIAPGAAPLVVQGDTIQITIQAAPGMDTTALARQIERVLDERDRNKAARLRSALYDRS